MTHDFPTQFSKDLVPANELVAEIQDNHQQQRLVQALEILRYKNLEMMLGATASEIRQIQELARLPDIIEYCPKEPTEKRFGNPGKWISKGRQAFIVRTLDKKEVIDYSWTGWGPCEELGESYPITTAYRATLRGTGKALVAATVVISHHLYPDGHGLETWASNGAAIKCYLDNDAELIAQNTHEFDENGNKTRITRPTLDVSDPSAFIDKDGHTRTTDTRQYFAFPWTLSPDHPQYRSIS